MISSKELRIGNWVSNNRESQGTIRFVTGIDTMPWNMVIKLQDIFFTEEELEPIPLSPTILEKCGFTRLLEYDLDDHIVYSIEGNDLLVIFEPNEGSEKYEDIVTVVHITDTSARFLHQLQNLYFFLSGNELNYKP